MNYLGKHKYIEHEIALAGDYHHMTYPKWPCLDSFRTLGVDFHINFYVCTPTITNKLLANYIRS